MSEEFLVGSRILLDDWLIDFFLKCDVDFVTAFDGKCNG